MENDNNALVCRVNFYGWSISGRRSLAEWFFNKFSLGEPVKGFTDAIFSPLLATDLAETLLKLIEHLSVGLFHVVNPQSISKYAFGLALAETFGFNKSLITPASIKDSGLAAARSPNLNLDPGKLIRELGESLPNQQMEMEKFHQQYLDGYPQRLKSYSSTIRKYWILCYENERWRFTMINRKSETRNSHHATNNRWLIALIILGLGVFACDLPAGLIPTTAPPTQIVATVASLPTQGPVEVTVEPTISVELGPTSTPRGHGNSYQSDPGEYPPGYTRSGCF